MRSEVFVSVIVPVYNAENYLGYSVKCIREQSYPNIEIILIDDGSNDRSPLICDQLSSEDSRIRVVHQSNGGPGKARNTGVEVAKGEWILFIDADDKIGKDYIRDLVEGVQDGVELVMACGFIRNSGAHITFSKESDFECSISDCISHIVHDVPDDYFNAWCGPWGKMFNKDIIHTNRLQFIENLGFLEDLVFCFQYFNCIKKAYISKTKAYDYLIVEGSLTHKHHSWCDVKRATDAYLIEIDKLASKYPDNRYLLDFRCKLVHLSELFLTASIVNNYNTMNAATRHDILAYCKQISRYLYVGVLPIIKGNKLAVLKHLPLWVSELFYRLKYNKNTALS